MFYKNRLPRSKHGNRKVNAPDGQKFDSQREYSRYIQLCLQERAGAISSLSRQKRYVLVPSVVIDGRTKPAIRYAADFVYIRDGKEIVEDAKSPHLRLNPVYRIKKHIMKHVHSIEIIEV